MYILYRDTVGTIRIDNVETITFLDGIVYFSAGMDDFQLWAWQVVEIGKGE